MTQRPPTSNPSAQPEPATELSLKRQLSPKNQLSELGLYAKKSFGQNFLSDTNISRRIAELAVEGLNPSPRGQPAQAGAQAVSGAEPSTERLVIEIGAGLGALTAPLLERAERVIAIERDRDLVPVLKERFSSEIQAGRLEVAEADAKQFDFRGALEGHRGPKIIAGNLPYQITGPLLELTAGLAPELCRAVFMVQLEVAQRLVATPGSTNYGALSVFTQAAFSAQRALTVKPAAFHPRPGVDSAVVLLIPNQPITPETPVFRELIRAAFAARRKTLRNAWRHLGPQLSEAAERAGIDLNSRGEILGVAQFAAMERALAEVEASCASAPHSSAAESRSPEQLASTAKTPRGDDAS